MSDALIRFIFFLSILFVLIVAETIMPKKCRVHPRQGRWATNGIITILNTATLNIMNIGIPLLAIGAALDASIKGWGFQSIKPTLLDRNYNCSHNFRLYSMGTTFS